MIKSNGKIKGLLEWSITNWQMDGQGGWQVQPVIIIQGEVPFYANHPQAYIDKLEEMHEDPTLLVGNFWTLIGQLRDGLENTWLLNREARRHNEKSRSR